MNTVPATLASVLLMLSLAQAAAQTVYRCGAGGREYSQSPCPAGREIDVSDARSADQRQAAAAVAQSQSRLADQLASERQARERSTPAQGPAGIRSGRPPDDVESILGKPSAGKSKKKGSLKPRKVPKAAKSPARAT